MERSRSRSERRWPKGLVSKTLLRWRRGRQEAISPVGWVAVRVGPGKERFLVRTEWMNHRLFRDLLDEAEREYGYATIGPLELPCSVELFRWVLWEVDQDEADAVAVTSASPVLCGFGSSPMRKSPASRFRLISSSRFVNKRRFGEP
ncbi:hypothetical protein HPP92_019676 [Vanilla planifolia]|uniref:Small auxin up regulated protein n=1 Tax=Vanilla planifolia TaxID=51239 RepID=A0A835QA32_VANPL|nr:hypothetical protein HPP92_019676 [Vanilla planifolia]